MSIRFFRIWITWLYWTEYIIMLYLHEFYYSAVSFAIFWGLNLFKQVGVSVYIICIRALYSWSIRGFSINHKFVINSSRKNVNNFCVTEINMSIKGSTVNQKVFPFSSVLLKLECNTQDPHFYDSAFYNSKET